MVSNFENTGVSGSVITPKDVLLSMREYIRNFFGCTYCREHFLKMAASMESDVTTNEEGVLWLWRRHNDVNLRLHGDTTEDPRHPKMQFPTYEQCQACHMSRPKTMFESTGWNVDEVLQFLLSYYGAQNMNQDAVPYNFHSDQDYFATAPLLFIHPLVTCISVVLGFYLQTV